MRTLIVLIFGLFAYNTFAQSIKTETFTVKGNCDECKKRIEDAADIKGVKLCVWNPDTKVATVTYNSEKTSLAKIQEAIAAKGHDAGEIKAPLKVYNKLPSCCKYHDGECKESKK